MAKVVHFVHRYPPALGGAESYVQRLSHFLAAQGDDVQVWTTTAMELTDLWQKPSQAYSWPDSDSVGVRRFPPLYFPLRRYVFKALSSLPGRRWQMQFQPSSPFCPDMLRSAKALSTKVDVVHGFAFPYAFPLWCAYLLAQRHQAKFALTPFLHWGDPHNPQDKTRQQYTKPHLRWLLRQADVIFVQTVGEHHAMEQLGVNPEKIVLQGLGVDPAECTGGHRERIREEWGIPPDTVVIGHLANLSPQKGTVDLLQCVPKLRQANVDFRVVLAGPEMPAFRESWATFPHKDKVMSLGPISESEKRDFFAGIDIFCLPSRTDSFGLVLLEAWANTVTNVVYAAGGPGELVRHAVDGLVVPCGDVHTLSVALQQLVEEPALRKQFGQAGQTRCQQDFSWQEKLEIVRESVHS